MLSMRIIFAGVLAIMMVASVACGRTWTSTVGATVDAEFVKKEVGYVVLERKGGGRLKIQEIYLSQQDRDYIAGLSGKGNESQQQLSDDEIAGLFGVDKTQKNEGASTVEDVAGVDESEAEALLDPGNFEPASKREINSFKAPRFKPDENTLYIGLQYGVRSNDVVFVAFERDSKDAPPSTAYVHDLNPKRIGSETFRIRGRNSRQDYENRECRVARFSDIEVESSFEGYTMKSSLEILYGLGGGDRVYVHADVQMGEHSRDAIDFHLFGSVPSSTTLTGTVVTPYNLFGKPQMELRVAYKRVYGLIKVGDLEMIPGRKSIRDLTIKIKNSDGKLLEECEAKLDDDSFFAPRNRSQHIFCEPDELKKSGDYIIEAKLDLTPVFAPIEAQDDYTVN